MFQLGPQINLKFWKSETFKKIQPGHCGKYCLCLTLSWFVQQKPTFSITASQDSTFLNEACDRKPSSKPTTLLLIYQYVSPGFFSSLSYQYLNVKWKNSAFARSILILAFSGRLQVQKVTHGFAMAHKCILRFYKRSLDFMGTLFITSETALPTMDKRMKGAHQRLWVLSKSIPDKSSYLTHQFPF